LRLPGLRLARQRKLLNQDELAERAGLSRGTIQRLEAGNDARLPTVRKLADALDVPIDDLLIDSRIKEIVDSAERFVRGHPQPADWSEWARRVPENQRSIFRAIRDNSVQAYSLDQQMKAQAPAGNLPSLHELSSDLGRMLDQAYRDWDSPDPR